MSDCKRCNGTGGPIVKLRPGDVRRTGVKEGYVAGDGKCPDCGGTGKVIS